MRWIGQLASEDGLNVYFAPTEVVAFHEAFDEWCRTRRPSTDKELELEMVWAQIHLDAADGMQGDLNEYISTAGMLGIYGAETVEALRLQNAGFSDNLAEAAAPLRLGVQPSPELGVVASRMALDIYKKIGQDVPLDTEELADAFYTDYLRQSVA